MKMNLRKNSAEPLNYESIFSGQGQLEMLVEILRRVGEVLQDIERYFV